MPEGMAADAQRDQGCRAASGAFQPLIESRPAAPFELPVAGILFALRPAEPDQPGFRVAESDADARKRQCSDSAGGKEVGREAFFPRLPAESRAIELRAPSPEPIDRLSRPASNCRHTVVLGSGPIIMSATSSWPELIMWRDGARRCELWMSSGVPELRVFTGNTLLYKERAPIESLYERAEQLRGLRA
jgi:hypothetical protein